MKSIIKELFYGNICPSTDCRNYNKKTKDLMESLADNHSSLKLILPIHLFSDTWHMDPSPFCLLVLFISVSFLFLETNLETNWETIFKITKRKLRIFFTKVLKNCIKKAISTWNQVKIAFLEAPLGFGPRNRGFADLCLTTWPWRLILFW